MGADVLATQGARASATIIFTMFTSINLVLACEVLINPIMPRLSLHLDVIFQVCLRDFCFHGGFIYFDVLKWIQHSQGEDKIYQRISADILPTESPRLIDLNVMKSGGGWVVLLIATSRPDQPATPAGHNELAHIRFAGLLISIWRPWADWSIVGSKGDEGWTQEMGLSHDRTLMA